MATRRGPDNTMRTAITGSHGTSVWANIFWTSHTASGVVDQASVDTMSTALAQAFITAFNDVQSDTNLYTARKSTYFTPGGGALQSVGALTGGGSNNTGFDLPANCAFVVSWIANIYWRGGKPRTYLSGGRSSQIQGTTALTSAAVLAIDGSADQFRTAVNALTAGTVSATQLGFVSFRTNNEERVPPLFYPYTGHKVHTRLDSQRRRLGRETV